MIIYLWYTYCHFWWDTEAKPFSTRLTSPSDASLRSVAWKRHLYISVNYFDKKLYCRHWTWINLCTPTKDFLRASKEEEYNIFFLIFALSGHLLIEVAIQRVHDMCVRVRVPGHQEELLLLARLGRSLALVLVLVVIQPVPDHISKVRVNPPYSDKDPNAILVPKKCATNI